MREHPFTLRDRYTSFRYMSWIIGIVLISVLSVIGLILTAVSFFSDYIDKSFVSIMWYSTIFIIAVTIASRYLLLYYYKFICPHCLKTIYARKITDITCPFCNESKNYYHLFTKCSCGSVIPSYECPHCQGEIEMTKEYDKSSLSRSRYE